MGISDLDANVHPFVVFGNEEGYPSFDPKTYGIKPLSVMAVVCNEQLVRTNQCCNSFVFERSSTDEFLTSTMEFGEIQMAVRLSAKHLWP